MRHTKEALATLLLCLALVFAMMPRVSPTTNARESKPELPMKLQTFESESVFQPILFQSSLQTEEITPVPEPATNDQVITIQMKTTETMSYTVDINNQTQLTEISQLITECLNESINSLVPKTGGVVEEINDFQVQVQSGESYLEIAKWYIIWILFVPLVYGARVHTHLSTIDAINDKSALMALNALLPLLIALLAPTLVGALTAIFIGVIIAMMNVDYNTVYTADKNEDDSFDLWWDMTPYTIALWRLMCGMLLNTPHYLWMVSIIGAYIIAEAPEVYFAFYAMDYYVWKPISLIYYLGPNNDIYTQWKAASTMATYDECNEGGLLP